MKVFGREPAFWTGLVSAVLALLLSWQALDLTAETVGAIMAVVTAGFGFYTAWVTRDTLLGVGVGAVNAVAALVAAYGFNLTENQTAAVIGIVTIALGAFQRTQTSPLLVPSFDTGVSA